MNRDWRYARRRKQFRRRRSNVRRFFDYGLSLVLLLLLAFMAGRLDRVATRTEQGRAIVNDGDTLTLGQERIRLRGIDAPEIAQTCQRAGAEYACGRMAKQALNDLVAGRHVTCKGWQRDRYGRLLARCRAGDIDLNSALVAAGWAVAYGDYEQEEARARAARAGIWAGDFERPQDWRNLHSGQKERRHNVLGSLGDLLREMFGMR